MRVAVRGQEEQVFEPEDGDTFAADVSHFVDCLTTGNRPLNTEVEGIGVLGIILAAYESSRTRKAADVLSL